MRFTTYPSLPDTSYSIRPVLPDTACPISRFRGKQGSKEQGSTEGAQGSHRGAQGGTEGGAQRSHRGAQGSHRGVTGGLRGAQGSHRGAQGGTAHRAQFYSPRPAPIQRQPVRPSSITETVSTSSCNTVLRTASASHRHLIHNRKKNPTENCFSCGSRSEGLAPLVGAERTKESSAGPPRGDIRPRRERTSINHARSREFRVHAGPAAGGRDVLVDAACPPAEERTVFRHGHPRGRMSHASGMLK